MPLLLIIAAECVANWRAPIFSVQIELREKFMFIFLQWISTICPLNCWLQNNRLVCYILCLRFNYHPCISVCFRTESIVLLSIVSVASHKDKKSKYIVLLNQYANLASLQWKLWSTYCNWWGSRSWCNCCSWPWHKNRWLK